RAVDVGVGHQDDAVVAQLVRVVLVLADAGAQRGDQRADFGAAEHTVEARALDVEDLALERQDRLGLAVAALLGRAACGVALDDEQFAQRRVFFLAVGELAGQAGDVERALAAGQVARLARGFARTRGVDDLAGDRARFVRVFLQELLEPRAEGAFHHRTHFRADQLFLGLRGEARVRHLHRQHRDHAFAHVVARQRDFRLLGDAALLDVVGQRARERGAETDQVGAAVL
ncbi:hypothetical protein CATMIT_01509, partial [Catenibacterium mitsuokai DSM 15897]